MADSPKEAEAAQALFCSIADYVGKDKIDKILSLKIYKTYHLFKKSQEENINIAYKQLDVPGISLEKIEKFLTDKTDWYESSVLTAVKLIKELSTIDPDFEKLSKPKWQNIFYVRGAKADKGRSANTMENIEALWKIANKNDYKFGDVNKWSPADIYFVSENAEKIVKDEVISLTKKARKGSGKIQDSYDFTDLNSLVNKLVDDGDLLPLSLKKVQKSATLLKYNFDRKKEEKELADIKYYGISDWSRLYTPQKPVTRDIKIYFSPDKKAKLKIRHDPTNDRFSVTKAIKAEIEVSGAGGRGGSTTSMNIISQIISRVDKQFANEVKTAYDRGIKEYENELQKLNIAYGVKAGQNKNVLKSTNPKQYEAYKEDRIHLSGVHLLNKLMPTIYKWFKGNEGDKKLEHLNVKVLQKFIEYTSSRSPQSGKFVITKS
tara:strand:- start:50 stop:1348 length:1299 start_codon:yes stop_codon:yes gene_type:complete